MATSPSSAWIRSARAMSPRSVALPPNRCAIWRVRPWARIATPSSSDARNCRPTRSSTHCRLSLRARRGLRSRRLRGMRHDCRWPPDTRADNGRGETPPDEPTHAASRRRACSLRGDRIGLRPGRPARVLRIVVPFVPGSFTDVSARLVANELSEQLGQSVVVENRGGAGGTAGTTVVVRAPPDGYTLLLTDTSLAISPGLYPNLAYDPLRDLAQISRIADSPSILLVRPGLGPRTLGEL